MPGGPDLLVDDLRLFFAFFFFFFSLCEGVDAAMPDGPYVLLGQHKYLFMCMKG